MIKYPAGKSLNRSSGCGVFVFSHVCVCMFVCFMTNMIIFQNYGYLMKIGPWHYRMWWWGRGSPVHSLWNWDCFICGLGGGREGSEKCVSWSHHHPAIWHVRKGGQVPQSLCKYVSFFPEERPAGGLTQFELSISGQCPWNFQTVSFPFSCFSPLGFCFHHQQEFFLLLGDEGPARCV